jgi:multidrug resistance efflux pump
VAKADLLAKQAQERVAQAELKVSGVNLKLKTDDLNRARHMKEGVAITEATLTQRERAYEEAVAQVELSKESLKQAQAQTFLSQAYVERLSIKAPTDGKILKIYIRPGELLQNASTQNYALLLGKDQPLYIRVQIDENDLWRFDPKTPAKAYLKSHKEKTFDLKFVQLDPYASVKENLNGDNRQLIDTRVVELIYEILSPVPTLVIGQQMDIYIQSKNEY